MTANIYTECGYTVLNQPYVPQWNRWRNSCDSCNARPVTWDRPTGACESCGGSLTVVFDEAVLDLEVRSARAPRAFLDVTVHHSVPGDGVRLAAAAEHPGAVNREAEAEKRRRYPDGRAPWRVVPSALETHGRLGTSTLKHLRGLARARAQDLPEGGGDSPLASSINK